MYLSNYHHASHIPTESARMGLLFCAETSARRRLAGTALRHNPLSRKRGNP
jgi:hypothetical protein